VGDMVTYYLMVWERTMLVRVSTSLNSNNRKPMTTSELFSQIDLIVPLSLAYFILFTITTRLQSMKIGFGWSVLACLLAGAVDVLIPVIGRVLAFGIILFSIWKPTRCEIMPEGMLSASIVWGVVLLLQLFVIFDGGDQFREKDNWRVTEIVATQLGRVQNDQSKTGKKLADLESLKLSGISISENKRLVLLQTDVGNYVLSVGELLRVRTQKTPMSVFCKSVSEDSVVLLVGPDRVQLELVLGLGV
jgi:hypothetical protein